MESTHNPYPQQPEQSFLRQFRWPVVIALIVLIVVLILLQIQSRLHTGKLVVNTNSKDNVISVTPSTFEQNSTTDQAKISKKPLTYKNGRAIRLSPGSYFITVSSGEISANQTVTIAAHQSYEYTINLPASVPTADPLGDLNAKQFNVGNGVLYYLDNRNKTLNKVDSSNRISVVSNQTLSSMQWADADVGVAQDDSGNLYYISNGSMAPLTLPAHSSTAKIVYAISPGQDIYVAIDKDVYGTSSNGFHRIYTSDAPAISLYASNDRVLISESYGEASGKKPKIVSVDRAGTVHEKEITDVDAFGYSWSPDGNHLFSVVEGPGLIYDKALEQTGFVPTALPTAYTWGDENSLYYSQNGQIWLYNLSTQSGKVIAKTSGGQTIVGMQLSPDKSSLYLGVQSSSNGNSYYSLYRYNTTGQTAPSAVSQLHSHLPWLIDGCFLGMVDFTSPTVEVSQSQPYDDCVATAKTYVKSFGIDPGLFNYQLSNVLPTTPSPN